MFSFTKKQKVIDIIDVKFGGQPGEYPTVLFGGLFFKGKPDFSNAKKHIENMYKLSRKTGNPAVPDFFIKDEKYIPNIVNFIGKTIPKTKPFSIDIIETEIKIKALKALDDSNLLSRTIYNSIHIGIKNEEQKALRRYKPEAVIIVAFNPKDKSPDGKIEVLENSANLLDKGLLSIAEEIGLNKILVDTAAMAPGDYSGASVSAIPVIKEEYGLPTGCAIHNVVEKSAWLNDFKDVKKSVDASSNINIPLFGGDFAIFGPIQNADLVFPIVAWEDILVSEYTDSYFGVKPAENHPRRKFF